MQQNKDLQALLVRKRLTERILKKGMLVMKKILLSMLCLALIVPTAACLSAATANPPVPGGTPLAPAVPPAALPAAPNPPDVVLPQEPPTLFRAQDGDVTIEVMLPGEPLSTDDFIHVYMQIGNSGGKNFAYTHGSGSQVVPGAIQIDLGGLFGVYNPAVMTMDFQTRVLKPGDILEFDLAFAPFVPAVEFPMPMPRGSGIEFFIDNDEFTPAAPGVYNGTMTFRFAEVEDPEDLSALFLLGEDDYTVLTVKISFVLV